ncbi:MAG: UDP-N-acetylmuramate dehydrogenase [Arenicella sp.]|nr:UDP-N-acetylmuramate dehydrogenase [Arenicella sp.]
MGVPALAEQFVSVNSSEELQQALHYVTEQGLPYMILGGGSNTLFKQDYSGLVIHNQLTGINVLEQTNDHVLVQVAAGENWHQWVTYCLARQWHGLENLALIPGLMGAAPMQNIGAYGVELKDVLHAVEYFDSIDHRFHQLTNAECEFDYRDSIFKKQLAGRAVITSVRFKLPTKFSPVLGYPELNKTLKNKPDPTAAEVFNAVCQVRNAKLPSPSAIPNSGSFFKNPVVSRGQLTELRAHYPEIVSFVHGDKIKLAAAWMIEQAGWKQREYDGVCIHQHQALVIINPGHRPGDAVLALAKNIQADIMRKFNVELQLEPQVY